MLDFLNFPFFVNFFYFWFVLGIAFYIPGSVILSRVKLSSFQDFVLGSIVGMVFWGWQAYLFGYLHLRNLSYIYIIVFVFLWIKINRIRIKKISLKDIGVQKLDKIIVFLIVAGVFVQLTSVFFTGVILEKGMYFCCGNVSDNILNIAISNQVVNNFPPFEPGYYGKFITNYHYWSSFVVGELVRIFRLPLIETNYQYITIFISLFLGLSGLIFSQLLKLGKAFTRWLIFFLYFGSDLIWVFVAVLRGSSFFAMRPLESGQQFLENIPRAMAVVVIFAGFSLFLILLKKKDLLLGIILAFVFASLIGFKVYLSFFIFPGLGVLAIYYFLKKNFIGLSSILLTFFLSALIYFPINSGAGGLYFVGLWRFENFIVQPYLGDLSRMELAKLIYLNHKSWLRVIQYEFTYILIFIVAIFGTKTLGLIQSKKSLSLLPLDLNILLIPGIISGFILGSLFNQTSGGSNTFNFLVSVFIISSIYSALSLSHFLKREKIVNIAIIMIVLSLTLPRILNQSYQNLEDVAFSRGYTIPNAELEGLMFLKNIKTESLVLSDPNLLKDKESPYISFISNQRMFLSGQGDELTAHSVNFSDRLKSLNIILYSTNSSSVRAELKKNNIGYLFLLSETQLVSTKSADFLQEVFNNKKVKILEVKMNNNHSN